MRGLAVVFLMLTALVPEPGGLHAEPRPMPTLGPSDVDFRHFPGHRYVTLTATRVQRAPVSTSRILADIPRLHVVYAERTGDDGWLAVRGAGASAYPDFDEAAGFVEFTEGRLHLPDIEDAGPYVSLVGYIPRGAVIDLDRTEPDAPPLPGLRPVPALWEKLGLPEPRSFATVVGAPPFDGIARLSSRGGYCTAFFVARDVVVTAGHCIPPKPPFSLSVTIERGESERDTIAGTLLDARRLNDSRAPGDDWAVILLHRTPRLQVTPLHFHYGDAFIGHVGVKVTLVGYPADLRAVSNKLLGFNAPVVSSCIALLPEARVTVSGDTKRSDLRLHAPCITFPGESGGPLLVWSADRGRYEVVGITSTYRDHDAITPVFSLSTSAMVRSFASDLAAQYGVPPIESGFGFTPTLREDTPGAALLSGMLPTFGAGQPWANFPLSTSLALAVGRATGHVPKMPVAALFQGDAPVRLRGAPPPRPFTPTELASARALCALRCTREQLDASRQERATIGFAMPRSAEDLPEVPGFPNWRWRVSGGDLFAIDPATATVRAVARDVMNLVGAGEDMEWDRRLACRCDKPASAVTLPGAGDAAPGDVAGARVMTASDVDALRAGDGAAMAVVGADPGPLRIPGARDAAFAARDEDGDPLADDNQRRLASLIDRLTGGDRDRPVTVYGRNPAARSGYNLAGRVIRLGYRHVIWLREGIAGWAAAGLPLAMPD